MKNSLFLFTFFILTVTASRGHAVFRVEQDRIIVRDILKIFSKGCVQRVSSDREIIQRLSLEHDRVNRLTAGESKLCFDGYFSQIMGVYLLYEKLCLDTGRLTDELSDDRLAFLLLDVNKYQTGIRPIHSSLNDCLSSITDGSGKQSLVPFAGSELDVKLLQRELDQVRVREPFMSLGEPLR